MEIVGSGSRLPVIANLQRLSLLEMWRDMGDEANDILVILLECPNLKSLAL